MTEVDYFYERRQTACTLSRLNKTLASYFDEGLTPGWKNDVKLHFVGVLEYRQLEDFMQIACSKVDRLGGDRDAAFRYFCGMCWNTMRRSADRQLDAGVTP